MENDTAVRRFWLDTDARTLSLFTEKDKVFNFVGGPRVDPNYTRHRVSTHAYTWSERRLPLRNVSKRYRTTTRSKF